MSKIEPGVREQLRAVARDPIVRVTAALLVATAVLYAIPAISTDARAAFSEFGIDLIFVPLIVAAFRVGLRHAGPGTHRLANYMTAAFAFWLAVRLFYLGFPDIQGLPPGDLISDLLYLAFYVCLVLASFTGAHEEVPLRAYDLARRVETAAGVFVVFFAVTYFVLVPIRVDYATYESWLPSVSLFLVLDAYVVLRFAALTRRAACSRYSLVYGLIASTAALWFVTDLLEWLSWSGAVPIEPGRATDLLWWPCYLVLVAAGRASHLPFASPDVAEEPAGVRRTQPALFTVPFITAAFLPPLIHLALYATELGDRRLRDPRELVLLLTLLVMGGLVLLQQAALARANRRLQEELEAATEILQHSEKMQAIGRLAGGIAHDFNNILTTILGRADGLIDGPATDPRSRHAAEEIRSAARRASALTGQLLAFARQQPLQVEPLDLNEVVDEMRTLLERLLGADVELVTRFGDGLGHVRADRSRIEQVVVNLVVNARDAISGSGVVVIETEEEDASLPDDAGHPQDPAAAVRLTVRDTGCGMDDATRERVFEPFFTTKDRSKGTGLGLAIVYGIVRQSGGTIHVDSARGEGTTVSVTLPRIDGHTRPEIEPAGIVVVSNPGSAPGTILVVEDEEAVRTLIHDVLVREGHRLLAASDGASALALDDALEGREIDLLVTDLVMPGMSGSQLATRLLLRRPGLKVLYISGYHDDDTIRAGDDTVDGAFLPKPFTPQTLSAKVREILATDPARRPDGIS